MKFSLVDVFAEGACSGNQLAVLHDAEGIGGDRMQDIAQEFNFSESTFITGGDLASGFDVRIFTPTRELPFAGHPTLGTASVIVEELLSSPVDVIKLNLGIGQIEVTFESDGIVWMRQVNPQLGEIHDRAVIAAFLNVSEDSLGSRTPVQCVSTGVEFIIVPVESQLALRRLNARDLDWAALSGDQGILVFTPEGYEKNQQLSARMFAAPLGVIEDAATGSAMGCLAAYLSTHQFFGSAEVDVVVGQGYEIDRPSQLYIKANPADDGIDVRVGGRVQKIATGQWVA